MEKDVRLGQEISQMKRAERSHAFFIDQQTLHFYLYGTRAVRGINVSELKREQTEDITEYTQGLQPSKKQKVTAGHDEPRLTNAIRSFPDEVQLCLSSIPGAGYGVRAKELIPLGTWIGPYEGRHLPAQAVTPNMDTSHLWEIFKRGTLSHYIDGSDEEHSSWMRFIRCARHIREQNLFSFQYCGNIFYRAFKQIGPGTELLVWYDDKYPHCLGIPLGVQDYETMRDAANTPPKSISWISTNTSCTNQQHSTQDSKNNDLLESWKKNGSGNFKHPTTTAVQPGLLFKQSSILNTSKQELLPSLNHNTVMTAKAGRRSKMRSFSLDNRGSQSSSTPSERASRHYIPHLLQTASIKETKLLSHQGFYHPPRQTARDYESSSDLKNPRRAVEGQTSSALNGGLFPHSGSSVVQEGNSQSITSFLAHHHQTTSQVANQEQAIKRYQTESKLEIPYSSHLTHHMPPPLTTDFNPRYSQGFELQTPGLDSDEFGMWRCRQCLKTFTQRVLLQLHICPETPRKPYQCGHCTLSFATPSDLRNHVETHTNDKPFKCGFCSRSFSGATTLNNHIRTHTGEKPFNCDNCMRTFSQASRLARHQRDCPPLDSSTCFYQFTPKKA